jgi:hypothetical protein
MNKNIGVLGRATIATIVTVVMLAFVGFMAPAFASDLNNPNASFLDLASALAILGLPLVAIGTAWVLVFKQPNPNTKSISRTVIVAVIILVTVAFYLIIQRVLS